jgi:hypothetical protein
MDNRTDQTEDLQSTPEHPAGRVPGVPSEPNASGLTAGPHNDAPRSDGVADTTQPWQERVDASGSASKDGSAPLGSEGSLSREGSSSRMKTFTQSVSGNPIPWLISAAGLALLLLAFQRAHRH